LFTIEIFEKNLDEEDNFSKITLFSYTKTTCIHDRIQIKTVNVSQLTKLDPF